MTAHTESTHTYGLGKLSEMRPDVTDADNQRDATFRAQYLSLIHIYGGEVTLLGQRVYAAGPNADAYRAARHGIGMVFQNPEDQLVTTCLLYTSRCV